MVRIILQRLVLPIVVYIVFAILTVLFIPKSYGNTQDAAIIAGLALLVTWWGLMLARWMHGIHWLNIIAYIVAHLVVTGSIFIIIGMSGYAFQSVNSSFGVALAVLSVLLAISWLVGALFHLIRNGRKYQYQSLWWRLLSIESETSKESITSRSQRNDELDKTPFSVTPNTPIPLVVPRAPSTASSREVDKSIFHQVSLAGEDSRNESVIIPPPKKASPFLTPPPKNIPSPRKTIEETQPFVGIRIEGPTNTFLDEARRYANRTQTRAKFVPFMHYWPTYADMDRDQQAWYFYWRAELRNGQILSTDTSYIFLHIYELLNLIGVPSPQAALEQLVALWNNYREDQPKLDNYLVDWIADFLVIHRLPINPLDWYAQALERGTRTHQNTDLFLEAWLRKGSDIDELNADLLYGIAGYSPKRSKFYKAYQDTFDFDSAFKLGISAVDKYLIRSGKSGIIQMHAPKKYIKLTRSPFASAIHGYTVDNVFIAEVRLWTSNAVLSGALSSVLRQTENVLRNQLSYRTQLRGVSVPKGWNEAINAAFIVPPPKRAIDIDIVHAERIREESEAIRQRLMIDDETEPNRTGIDPEKENKIPEATSQQLLNIDAVHAKRISEESETIRQRLIPNDETRADEASMENVTTPDFASQQLVGFFPSTQSAGVAPHSVTQRPADTPDGLLTDLPAVVQITGQANSESVRLLSVLRENGWQASPVMLGGYFENTFVNVIFDRINEIAFDVLGDAVLFDEGGEWVVAEDYRDEIAYILDHPDYRKHVTS